MSGAFVHIKNVSFAFSNGAKVLRDFSLMIAKGECVGLSGPSGCGKTTLALVIAGHLRPSGGEIEIDGQSVIGRPQRDVFLIHQDSDLFPWLTVQKQIAFALKTPKPLRVQELIDLTKLTGFENYYPHQLSGGMKKRLSIARALAVEAKLLIFDESFSSLDLDLRRDLILDLKKIWSVTQTTILLITHDPQDNRAVVHREVSL